MDPFVGEIHIFAGSFAPQGWFLCQGQTLQISQYQVLFAVIGNRYGGDGRANFQLPNLQGRVPIGVGTTPAQQTYALGKSGGYEFITLKQEQMPAHNHLAPSLGHTHPVTMPAHTHNFNLPQHQHDLYSPCDSSGGGGDPTNAYCGNGGVYGTSGDAKMAKATSELSSSALAGLTGTAAAITGQSGEAAQSIVIQPTGGSQPFQNTPLYATVNYIIAYMGIYPTQG